jgi:hypothetical protein
MRAQTSFFFREDRFSNRDCFPSQDNENHWDELPEKGRRNLSVLGAFKNKILTINDNEHPMILTK